MPGKRINKSKPKAPPAKSKRKNGKKQALSLYRTGLDKASNDWIKLMADPCSADLVSPCYGGTGTGYLARVRDYVPVPATARDYILEFTPSADSLSVYRYGYSVDVGGSLGTVSYKGLGGIPGNKTMCSRRRCVAACLKVIYTGAELDRSGMVAMTLDSGMSLLYNQLIVPTTSDWLTCMPHTARMGSAIHEVLWVPGSGDEQFIATAVGTEESPFVSNGNSLQLVIRGAPTSSFAVEVTSVWEWQPVEDSVNVQTNFSQVALMRGPPTGIPLSTILSAIGSVGKFALHRALGVSPLTGPVGPVIREFLQPTLRALAV